VAAAIAKLSATLGVAAEDNSDDIEAAFFAAPNIAPREWPAIAKVLAGGKKSDCEQADRFRSLTALDGEEKVEAYLDIFFTAPGSGRTFRMSIVTGAISDARLIERLQDEQERVGALLQRRRAVACRDRSAALLTVAYEVLTRYAKEKERRGLLDYDDLIDKALHLLSDCEAAWVHFKLDLGIDHLLVDEAQDTSHKQWDIIRRLTAEFTAGAGARPVKRTIFAVGDDKQSIYSFQNAAPKEFAAMQRYFRTAHEQIGEPFYDGKFEHSFRSGESILAAVDAVFKSPGIAASVTSDSAGFPPHIALPDARPGVVEIWEPFQPDERRDIEGWDAPFDVVSGTNPRVKLARRIAREVRTMVDAGATRYGDVLVLVRQRGELFEAVIRALKNAKVDVAGADRLMLTEHIAVMDLIALADALLLPQDDLALATVLRSPLFGFSDEDLFDVAWDRRTSLRTALERKAADKPIFAEAAARLDDLAQAAQRETPFAFYALLLGQGGVRRRFLARLGPEANDAIDEFLNLTLDYERRETPSLRGLVAWLRDARAEVKRDMEIRRDEVRVMTVHGAKGLEAPVVILADTITPPTGPRPPRLLTLAGGEVVWGGRKADDIAPVGDARSLALAEAEDEYRRLLYVAMTRAAQRLIVCGADGMTKRPDSCWYNLVRKALEPLLVAEGDGDERIWIYRKPPNAGAVSPGPGSSASPAAGIATEPAALPAWLSRPVVPESPRPLAISPSTAFDDEIGGFARAAGTAADRQKALRKGRIVHRLMQSLPDIGMAARKDAIERYLAREAADFSDAERASIAQQVQTLLNDLVFADLFVTGSRAEVPIVGRIARTGRAPILVSGQIDRLAVTTDSVLIADYKTDREVPRNLADVAPYVGQLALYRAVLARLYPDKTIRAALIFTAGPRVIEVPGPAMEAALVEFFRKNEAKVTLR